MDKVDNISSGNQFEGIIGDSEGLTKIYMIFIQSINEIQAEVNSLDNDLAVLLLVIQGLGRVQAPWIDHRGNIT